jgi:hypothetical protein
MNKKLLLALISSCTFFGFTSAVNAADAPTPMPNISDSWRYSVTPYVWAVGVSGTVGTNDGVAKTANMSTSNVISDLKGGFMISGEAHKGNWGIGLDVLNANLGNQPAKTATGTLPNGVTVNADLSTKVNLKDTLITGAAMYTLVSNPALYMDGLVGARFISTTASINANLNVTGTVDGQVVANKTMNRYPSMTTNTTDPIVGLKGRYRLADSAWYVPYYGDIGSGGGTTNLTWQAYLGIGKAYDWGDITLGYRALYYDMKSSGTLQKVTFQGAALAATFNF